MEMDNSRKMEMSLDEIILYEQKKKVFRGQCSTDSDDESSMLIDGASPLKSPDVSMVPVEFSEQPVFMRNSFKRRQQPGAGGDRWIQGTHKKYNYIKNKNAQNVPLRKPYSGIPLLKLKRGFEQSRRGMRSNSYALWRHKYFGRHNFSRYNNGYPLTATNLSWFNQQHPFRHRRRGPGSVRSQGTLCSMCSNTSFKSNRSLRSNHSIRSQQSLRSQLSSSRRFFPMRSQHWDGSKRFKYVLKDDIQEEIRSMQEKKYERIINTAREQLIDEPSKCQPKPEATSISCNLRFKQFILNPLD